MTDEMTLNEIDNNNVLANDENTVDSDTSDDRPLTLNLDLQTRRRIRNGVGRVLSEEDLASRLVLPNGESVVHQRARRLRKHYHELESCDKIMAYGFILIMFLCTGFCWFINLFAKDIRNTFIDYHVIAPAFLYGTAFLGALNYFL
eukprot:TRINITY_DN7352_c0_g1_i2.p1 TRINITY_DN7352_c0_g1~~TRINITY_DN7352_c0_g1_i2.p1  ORF type:complete len:146 (+),score=17.31 TRINITY_DN7352_c0_g1_i2:25-462(+)